MLPNFLIIGAPKSGTTSLAYYLQQHPDVFMCPFKECCFFLAEHSRLQFDGPGDRELNERIVTDISAYEQLFNTVSTETAVGEATVWYMYAPQAATNIKRHIPDVRIIAVLRNPVERALSSYSMTVREGRETCSLEDALAQEEQRIAANWEFIWHYRAAGLYCEQLQRYFDIFDRSQLRVYLYEDFRTAPQDVMRDIFRFIEVDSRFQPDTAIRLNVSGRPRVRFLQNLLSGRSAVRSVSRRLLPKRVRSRIRASLYGANLAPPPSLPPATATALHEAYAEDVAKLSVLIDRDLSAWTRTDEP